MLKKWECNKWFVLEKGYKLANSLINIGTGIKTMCVNKKSSRNGSFGPICPPKRVSNKCSSIFCGVPDITVYLSMKANNQKSVRKFANFIPKVQLIIQMN